MLIYENANCEFIDYSPIGKFGGGPPLLDSTFVKEGANIPVVFIGR